MAALPQAFPLLLLVLVACRKETAKPVPATPPAAGPALYRVMFEASWSATTHANFPAGAHFSPLMGVAQRTAGLIFRLGQLATMGIQNMAERGSNTILRAEIATLRGTGRALGLLDGRGGTSSPGALTDTICLDAAHPYLTVVTMLAPSPDWFATFEDENLLETDGQWATRRTVPARTYDAGTDSGPTFTPPAQPTLPAQPIARLLLPPATGTAADGPPVGT